MRKSVVYLVLGVIVVGACILAALLDAFREPTLAIDEILASYREDAEYGGLTIRYPLDETLFPPEIVPPTFRWKDSDNKSDAWVVALEFQDDQGRLSFPCFDMVWTPSHEQWETIRRRSLEKPAKVTILGINHLAQDRILSAASISVSTSKDEVGAPIFYREVSLPFLTAVKSPAAHICWRFGEVSSKERPPIVLDKLSVCGNCHSFSAEGTVLGMDVDYANDKGSYTINAVAEEVILDKSNIITWNDYRKEDGEVTFGLLSQVSPNGRYVASTVKDLSVFVPRDNLAFSQLFFPIKGILVIYDRKTKSFHPLPGADDKRFVQSNPTWSPDAKYIVFARSKVHQLKNPGKRKKVLLLPEECAEFLEGRQTFQFDLYRIPFNEGKGGKAEPLLGASHNGMSNYFAKYSPDGKWIAFCKAKSFMLLQPDSELYIIPADGGEARRMRCNTPRMNSWHSWSPNGRWIVFSSKWNSAYTQLFLTHVDETGRSSPPVLLSQFTAPDKAANIPEFVNVKAGAIKRIREQFIDDTSFLYAGQVNARVGFHDVAVRDLQKALELNPKNVDAHVALGASLAHQENLEEAKSHFVRAIELQPDNQYAYAGLGNVLAQQGRLQEALRSFFEAVRIDPEFAVGHFHLGVILLDLGNRDEGKKHLAKAVRLDPDNPQACYSLGVAFFREGKPDQALPHYRRALELDPNFLVALLRLASILATSNDPTLRDGEGAVELATRACELTRYEAPQALTALSEAYAEVGRFSEAVSVAQRALRIVRAAENESLTNAIRQRIEFYERSEPLRQSYSQ